MISALIYIWLGGMLATSPEVYEDWKDDLIEWDDAIMAVLLWPIMLVVWIWRELR